MCPAFDFSACGLLPHSHSKRILVSNTISEQMAEVVSLGFSLHELYMSATRNMIYHHRPHASFTDKDNQDWRHSKPPELCMHSDDHLYSWLPDTIGLVFFHLGSPICMRIVSNFAISRSE